MQHRMHTEYYLAEHNILNLDKQFCQGNSYYMYLCLTSSICVLLPQREEEQPITNEEELESGE